MSQKSFLDNKKSRKNFPYVGGGRGRGVNQHMENFMFSCFYFLKLPLITHQVQEMLSHLINFETSTWHFKVMKQKCINIITIQNGQTDRQENKVKPDLLCNCEIMYLYFNYPLHLWFVYMAWVIKNFYQAGKFYFFYTANPRGKGRLFNHQKILLFVIHITNKIESLYQAFCIWSLR